MQFIEYTSPVNFNSLAEAQGYLRDHAWREGHAGAWFHPQLSGWIRDIRKTGAQFAIVERRPVLSVKIVYADRTGNTYRREFPSRVEAEGRLALLEGLLEETRRNAPTSFGATDWLYECEAAAIRLACGIQHKDPFFHGVVCKLRSNEW